MKISSIMDCKKLVEIYEYSCRKQYVANPSLEKFDKFEKNIEVEKLQIYANKNCLK
jgi:hypothetical protein